MSQLPSTGVPVCYRHPGRESHIRCQRCGRPICPDCMRDASVGFQCPSCVAEGRKTTRSGRTAYGGLRPTNASTTSLVLIGINVAVWVAIIATGGNSSALLSRLQLVPQGVCRSGNGYYFPNVHAEGLCARVVGGQWFPGVADGAPWQLITSMFTHVQPTHIGFNMLALYILGPQLELAIGRTRFLALYFISGLGGSALFYLLADPSSGAVGASGAIFGLMAGLLVVVFKVKGDVRSVLTWVAINFVFTVVVSGIAWQAHVGGFVVGLACAGILVYAPRGPRRTAFQSSGLLAVTALVVLMIVVRTAALT